MRPGPVEGRLGSWTSVRQASVRSAVVAAREVRSDVVRDADGRAMRLALEEAAAAAAHDDVPVGAVVVRGDEVLGRGHNRREVDHDPTAHAEVLAIRAAAAALGSWQLTGCTLVVTLEPCVMCAGAVVLGRVDRLVYGADDPKAGAVGALYDVPRDPRLNHTVAVTRGVLADECGRVLRDFFDARR